MLLGLAGIFLTFQGILIQSVDGCMFFFVERRHSITEMAHMSFTICIFIFVIPSSTFVLSYGFKVIQPQVQDVNRDQTASISCENDAKRFTLQDVRLYSISQ
ncbi:hypothetical protein AMECASPLE_037686 [Ameca splendens]|uniref:Uncharacterized protein n=1 Tax=Ameca splendens TaxID=208324 RepID=A0ABV0Z751_9TELE